MHEAGNSKNVITLTETHKRQTNGNFLVWTSMTMGGCSQNHKCCHLTMKPQAAQLLRQLYSQYCTGLLMFTYLDRQGLEDSC